MIQIVNKKRFFLLIFVVMAIIAGIVWGIVKLKNRNDPENQPQTYEALVMVVDQKSSDPEEDARASLKKGDVIAYFSEGHSWSDTEKNSYLIVKIKIRPDDVTKLTEAETKNVKNDNNKNDEEDTRSRVETVRARKYYLDLPDYNLQKFWENHQQPFADKVFDDGIIEKK